MVRAACLARLAQSGQAPGSVELLGSLMDLLSIGQAEWTLLVCCKMDDALEAVSGRGECVVVVDERMQRRVRVMPLDVAEPAEIRGRLRAYLTALGVDEGLSEHYITEACEGVTHAGAAFARLRDLLVADLARSGAGVSDDPESAALARVSIWLSVDAVTLATLPLTPPLTRQSMASERVRP